MLARGAGLHSIALFLVRTDASNEPLLRFGRTAVVVCYDADS